jgi:hypothetical protein
MTQYLSNIAMLLVHKTVQKQVLSLASTVTAASSSSEIVIAGTKADQGSSAIILCHPSSLTDSDRVSSASASATLRASNAGLYPTSLEGNPVVLIATPAPAKIVHNG